MALSPLQLALSPVAGALFTLSPCVFPLLPMVVAGVGHAHHRIGPLAMGAGMVASFVVAGVVLAAAGPALGVRGEHVRIAAGLMLLAIATVRHGFAVLIGLPGLAVITGLDRTFEAAVLEILPDSWVELTTRL
jgi:cytochrome c biogenesis protein CcdA